ncbi:MAG: hemerythrin domain-containing protein [Alphaproteobacteria bacterium]|nr:hemerythrin domain-containing protein [Alphaproteobacteria bacterium]
MTFKYFCTRILYDDHVATLALLSEVERMFTSRREPPQIDEAYRRFIDRFCKALNVEVTGHFDFEETSLFPVVTEYGEGALCELLLEEHHVLLDVARDVITLAQGGRDGGFSAEDWGKLRRLCGELNERLISHIEKEDRALLPVMEDALTMELDSELAARHNDGV